MRFPYLAPGRGLPTQTERAQITDQTKFFGAPCALNPVREVNAIPAPRGLLMTWALPGGDSSNVVGYRVYVGTEKNLQQTITDRGTRQVVVPVTAGQPQNVIISAVDQRGNESPLTTTQVPGTAITEAGAPAFPSTPTDFNKGSGSDTDNSGGNSRIILDGGVLL